MIPYFGGASRGKKSGIHVVWMLAFASMTAGKGEQGRQRGGGQGERREGGKDGREGEGKENEERGSKDGREREGKENEERGASITWNGLSAGAGEAVILNLNIKKEVIIS